jgi:ribosome-associated protein
LARAGWLIRLSQNGDQTIESIQAAEIARAVCAEKKATDIRVLEVRALTIVADYFVICTAGSSVGARAIADEIAKRLKQQGRRLVGVEGREEGWWVLLDFGDVIAHIFQQDARQYYAIDQTWADAPEVGQVEAA